ncbi:MAG TPA: caspase family protein [Polyangiales bacterium]
MTRWLAACLIAFASAALVPSVQAERVVYAVAIGNNAPPVTRTDLPLLHYADDDAVRYYELLRRAGTHAQLLTVLDASTERRFPGLSAQSSAPTLGNLRRVLEAYRTSMQQDRAHGREPVLFLTFSGHGAISEQGEPFLALGDENLTRTVLYDEILPAFADMPIHLIFDACEAGALVGARGAFDSTLDALHAPLGADAAQLVHDRSLSRFPNVGALVASSAGEEAHEWSRIESGVFTHEVISALLGAADVNGDQRIEYSEVQSFVAAANRDVSDPRARPEVIALPPASNRHAVLIDLGQLHDVAFLRGDAGALGRFHVELENGLRWLEAHLDGKLEVVLALPRGIEAYVRTATRDAVVAATTRELALNSLQFAAPTDTGRGGIDSSYRKDLFRRPFGADYYRGFVDATGVPGVSFSRSRSPALHDPTRSKVPAIVALSAGGAAAVVAVVTAALALQTKADFDDTRLMRRASELDTRYRTLTTVSAVSLAVAALGGASGCVLWPGAAVSSEQHAGIALQLGLQGRW